MLIITRRINQAFLLIHPDGTRERIVILAGGKVGIDAPKDVKILREELCEPSMMRERE